MTRAAIPCGGVVGVTATSETPVNRRRLGRPAAAAQILRRASLITLIDCQRLPLASRARTRAVAERRPRRAFASSRRAPLLSATRTTPGHTEVALKRAAPMVVPWRRSRTVPRQRAATAHRSRRTAAPCLTSKLRPSSRSGVDRVGPAATAEAVRLVGADDRVVAAPAVEDARERRRDGLRADDAVVAATTVDDQAFGVGPATAPTSSACWRSSASTTRATCSAPTATSGRSAARPPSRGLCLQRAGARRPASAGRADRPSLPRGVGAVRIAARRRGPGPGDLRAGAGPAAPAAPRRRTALPARGAAQHLPDEPENREPAPAQRRAARRGKRHAALDARAAGGGARPA
jgi:hypothetical protein